MKKLILMIAAAGLSAGVAQAQKRIKDTIAPTTEQVETPKKQAAENEYKVKGGTSFNYGFVEKGYLFHINFMVKGYFLEYGMGSQDFKDAGFETDNWMVTAGYNYRYWLGRSVYLQGAAGIGYAHTKVTVKGSRDEDSSGGAIFTLRPALGLRVWKSMSLEAGYRWNFSEFKFDKEHTSDYFNIGINFGF